MHSSKDSKWKYWNWRCSVAIRFLLTSSMRWKLLTGKYMASIKFRGVRCSGTRTHFWRLMQNSDPDSLLPGEKSIISHKRQPGETLTEVWGQFLPALCKNINPIGHSCRMIKETMRLSPKSDLRVFVLLSLARRRPREICLSSINTLG